MIYALDPGYERSALIILAGERIEWSGLLANEDMLETLGGLTKSEYEWNNLVIEQIESYGMPVGREVFATVFWAGRFAQAWRGEWSLLPRRAVKLALCGSARANDATIRQALIDKYGPTKERAIGRKAAPGPLYGLKADLWAALALGVTYQQLKADGTLPKADSTETAA